MHHREHLPYGIADFGLRPFLHFQAEGDVLSDCHVWEKCIVLKNRIYRSLMWGKRADVIAIKQNCTLIGVVETSDQSQ